MKPKAFAPGCVVISDTAALLPMTYPCKTGMGDG